MYVQPLFLRRLAHTPQFLFYNGKHTRNPLHKHVFSYTNACGAWSHNTHSDHNGAGGGLPPSPPALPWCLW